LKLQVGAVLREQRVKIGPDRGSRWSKAWTLSVRDNERLSKHARWIVNDLLEEIGHTVGKIAQTAERLREATLDDPVIKRLKEQPGIGEVTAWVLRAYIGRFDRFKTAKQLARYCGMSPCNTSSGSKTADSGLIDGCNKLLRMTVVQAAHRLIRTVERWSGLAASLEKRGKPTCVIVGAVGNRWLRNLHHAMKTSTHGKGPDRDEITIQDSAASGLAGSEDWPWVRVDELGPSLGLLRFFPQRSREDRAVDTDLSEGKPSASDDPHGHPD
jgi:transposase